uniref:Uncharacterized protein n=1 Tax=viral metagenome TaxID=1070528 RepID=A0A6C0EW91_9ZZZZ
MDDFNINGLQESRNEYCSRLITILTPCIIDGVKSIFEESWKLCNENDEKAKYLMTFQNFLSRVPKWNPNIISQECSRIKEKSNCSYISDLITCVHILQLKMLSCMRVGTKQKKVNVNVPVLEDFVHKVYTNVARKIYTNVYLFEIGITSLKAQKNSRDLEIIIRECILQTIRENIPVEELLKLYMNETVEDVMEVHETDEIISQNAVIEEPVAGSVSDPLNSDSNNLSSEDKNTISKIKAASSSSISSSSSTSNGVSFNMKNNEIIEIEKISNDNKDDNDNDNNDNNDYNFEDSNGDDDYDDDEDNVRLKIGDNVELSVDAFPSDANDSDTEYDGNSDVDITIDEIPLLDD